MRVIIGVDGSADSFSALEFVGRLLDERAKITLYYAAPRLFAHNAPDAASGVAKLRGVLADAIFERSRQHLPPSLGAVTETFVDAHDPQHGLLLAADERQAELIVVGALGVGPAKPSSLGSVARHIAHNSHLPVLVVRGPAPQPAEPMRVLLAIAGDCERKDTADLLEKLSWPASSQGHVASVLETASPGSIPAWLAEQLSEEQLAALGMWRISSPDDAARRLTEVKQWCAALPPMFAARDPFIAVGHVGDQIVGLARERQVHLAVVGARRQGAIVRRLLLGSTSEYVLMHAPCSVLLVRDKRNA